MRRIPILITFLVFQCFHLQSQERNVSDIDKSILRDHDQVYALLVDHIRESDIQSIWSFGSNQLKQNSSLDELKMQLESFNAYLKENQYHSFEDFNNNGVSNEDTFREGNKRHKTRTFRSTPLYLKEKINPILTHPISTNLSLKLVWNGDIWLLDSIGFKRMDFEQEYDIEKHITDFLIADTTKYDFVVRITIFKKDHFKLITQGDLEELDLKMLISDRVGASRESSSIDPEHYSSILIQRRSIHEDAPNTDRKDLYEYLEMLFTDSNQVLISDSAQYGIYRIQEQSNLPEFIRNIVITFTNNGYR